MDHGRCNEPEAVFAQLQRVPFLDRQSTAGDVGSVEELAEHLDGLGAGDEGHVGITVHHPGDERGMVWLHVVHDEVVGLAAAEGFREIGLPFFFLADVGGVQDGYLPVEDQIGIVGHAFRDDVLALEKVEAGVVHSDILDCAVEGNCHCCCFFVFCKDSKLF